MSEVTKEQYNALRGEHDTLQRAFNALVARIDSIETRVDSHTENINLLRGDAQRMQDRGVTLAGPIAQPVGEHGLIPAALPDNRTAVVEGADAVVVNTDVDPATRMRAEAEAVASLRAQPTPASQLTPAQVAAEEALRRKAEISAERRAKRKGLG